MRIRLALIFSWTAFLVVLSHPSYADPFIDLGARSIGSLNTLYCQLTGCTMTGTLATNTITAATTSDISVNTASGKQVLVTAAAVAATAEKTTTFSIADDANGRLVVENGSAADATFLPQIRTFASGNIQSLIINTVSSTGTNSSPSISIFMCAGTPTGCTADITTGMLMQWVTFAGTLLSLAGTTAFNTLTWSAPLHVVSTKTVGTITLAAGTGTATVLSGAICVCTDTSASPLVFRCSVSGTTLTATEAAGANVISYICL